MLYLIRKLCNAKNAPVTEVKVFLIRILSLSLLYDTTRLCVLSTVCIIYTIIQVAWAICPYNKNSATTCRAFQCSVNVQQRLLPKVNRVQCDRGTGAHGVREGGETALFEPDVVFRHIKKAQHIMLRVF